MIHDALEDGAELTYEELTAVPEAQLSARLRTKEQLGIFREHRCNHDVPNYMPESVAQSLEEAGFSREEIEGTYSPPAAK